MQAALPALDPQVLQHNDISRDADGDLWCRLCWKGPMGNGQAKEHLQSKEHGRRMLNKQIEADPLACVPHPHRAVTEVFSGWARCRICKKRMHAGHWDSAKHIDWLNYYVANPHLLPPVDTLPPLLQPPPLPEQPNISCDIAVGSSATASQNLLPATSDKSMASAAQTFHGVRENGLPAASHVPHQLLQGYAAPASTQSQSPMPDPCGPFASQIMPPPSKLVTGMPLSLQASALQNDQQHPWGSRGLSGEVLNDDEWNQFLRKFDERYAGEWWPTDKKWVFVYV